MRKRYRFLVKKVQCYDVDVYGADRAEAEVKAVRLFDSIEKRTARDFFGKRVRVKVVRCCEYVDREFKYEVPRPGKKEVGYLMVRG